MSDDRDHTVAAATVAGEERPYGVRIDARGQALRGSVPVDHGGADTLRMYAGRKDLPLAGVDVTLTYIVKDQDTRSIDRLTSLHGGDDDQRARLAGIADRTPVTVAVRAGTEIRTTTEAA